MQKLWLIAKTIVFAIFTVVAIILVFLLIFYGTLPKSEPIPIGSQKPSEMPAEVTGTEVVNGAGNQEGANSDGRTESAIDEKTLPVVTEDNVSESKDPIAESETLPDGLLSQAISELESITPPPGFSEDAASIIQSGSVQETVSIADFPEEIGALMYSDLEFRNKNGYDIEVDSYAESITSVGNNLAGTDINDANIEFSVSTIPQYIQENYQFLGYSYPPGAEDQTEFNTVRRVFSKLDDNSTLVLEESSLKDGSATLTTEFVNESIGNCPAMLIEKRNASYGRYGQLHWNTSTIGYTMYQLGKENVLDGLSNMGRLIAVANPAIHDC